MQIQRKLPTVIAVIIAFVYILAVDARSGQVTGLKSSPSTAKCILTGFPTDERPEPADRPTVVEVGLSIIDVTAIEDTSQSITADFAVSLSWTDPRLIGFEGCRFDLNEVWAPELGFTNSGRLFTRFAKTVEVFDGGRARYYNRYHGPLVFVYDAHRFPFDSHDIVISLLSDLYSQDEVTLTVNKTITGRNLAEFSISDWTISSIQPSVVTKYLQISDSDHSEFEIIISAKRRAGYYIWKVMLPLMLIVLMSWTVLWINPEQSGTQIGMSATSMLTLIAFQFAIGNILPRLSYFTVLDKFITVSTVMVFLALIESVSTSYLIYNQKKDKAMRMDQICRWAFPSAFVVLILFIFFS